MKKINWKVRCKNKMFWLTLIPTVLLLASQVLKMFGVDFDYTGLSEQLEAIISTLFTRMMGPLLAARVALM